jgi:hypothetical protein
MASRFFQNLILAGLMIGLIHGLPLSNDCELCLIIIKSPESTVVCRSQPCRNMTERIARVLNYTDLKKQGITAQEFCTDLRYCYPSLEQEELYLALDLEEERWIDLIIDFNPVVEY